MFFLLLSSFFSPSSFFAKVFASPTATTTIDTTTTSVKTRKLRCMLLFVLALLNPSSVVVVDARKPWHRWARLLGGENTCAVEDECGPDEIWWHRPDDYPAYANGCGSASIPVNIARHGDFTPCCNVHDVCYASCGQTKMDCDEAFHMCMIDHCKEKYINPFASSSRHRRELELLELCLDEASLYYSGTVGFACMAYRTAQKNHCSCHQQQQPEEEGGGGGGRGQEELLVEGPVQSEAGEEQHEKEGNFSVEEGATEFVQIGGGGSQQILPNSDALESSC